MHSLSKAAGAALLAALAACSSSSNSAPRSTGGTTPTSTARTTSTAPHSTTCADLVGQPVRAAQTCDDVGARFDEPGSAGCYPGDGSKQVGSFYYIGASTGMIFGKPGGVWLAGKGDESLTAMAAALGC